MKMHAGETQLFGSSTVWYTCCTITRILRFGCYGFDTSRFSNPTVLLERHNIIHKDLESWAPELAHNLTSHLYLLIVDIPQWRVSCFWKELTRIVILEYVQDTNTSRKIHPSESKATIANMYVHENKIVVGVLALIHCIVRVWIFNAKILYQHFFASRPPLSLLVRHSGPLGW